MSYTRAGSEELAEQYEYNYIQPLHRSPLICISPPHRAHVRKAALQLEGSLRGCPTLPPLAGAAFAGIVSSSRDSWDKVSFFEITDFTYLK
jgi:hypothetical protein